jgi:Cd2+/Zn2+-exporting ATPase
MTERTVELQIPILLPGVEDEQDRCLARLETALSAQKGILRSHLENDKHPLDLCLHYDPNLLSLADVRRLAENAGAQIVNRFHHSLIPIEGMDCSDCALVVEHSIGRLDGVLAVNVNYATQQMWVEYDRQLTSQTAIEKRVRSLGYSIPMEGLQNWLQVNRELFSSLLAGILLVIGWAGGRFLGLPGLAVTALYLGAYVLGGWHVATHAWLALRQRHFDTDLLMVVAALGAAALGDFAEGALLLFLFSLGHAFEERALERARRAVKALADLAPRTALVKRTYGEQEIPVEQVAVGETVIIPPGSRLPVDGELLSGRSTVDQSPVTGESIPVEKAPGDKLFAGTVNGDGALEVRVTRLARDSTLARVMKMVEDAQLQKSPSQQLADRFGRVFVPIVLLVDLLFIVVPPLFGVPFQAAFLRAMTLLVAASPCALALGAPAAVLAGVAQAARNGILIKGGAHLENLGRLEAIAFDKTGTLTYGRPELIDVLPVATGSLPQGKAVDSPDSLLALCAAAESRSTHPLAKAVVEAASQRGLSLPEVQAVEAQPGKGLRASFRDAELLLGNPDLLEEAGVEISQEVRQKVADLRQVGKTVMLAAWDGRLLGLLSLADRLRPNASRILADLRQAGIHKFWMLTGDHPDVAAVIAAQAGVDEFRAELLPEDKLQALREFLKQADWVAMVGDGINDAPALAHATVGIAMGGAGSDVALESADVALMSDRLERLPFAIRLGRRARAVILQNLAIALGVIALLSLAAITGWVSIGLAVAIHEGSTLLVVVNALRLLSYQPG